MKRKKQKNGQIILTLLVIAAIVVCGFVAYEYFFKAETPKSTEASTQITPQPQPTPATNQKPETPPEPTPTPVEVPAKDPVTQYEGNNPNVNSGITGAITYAGKTSTDFLVRINIDQYLENGTCTITMSKEGAASYTNSVPLIADVATSTCQGFNVPLANLEAGHYLITVEMYTNGRSGTIQKEVDL